MDRFLQGLFAFNTVYMVSLDPADKESFDGELLALVNTGIVICLFINSLVNEISNCHCFLRALMSSKNMGRST